MQIGKGADLIKLYGDYRWGPRKEPRPTFTTKELELVVELAASSGRQVAVHASTSEGMRRAILAGVSTIEHGDEGNPELFRLMKEKKVALCATLAAGDAILQYRGWKKGRDPEPERIKTKRKVFRQALDAGVTICMGGDVGVFTHGDNAREMELMVDYGMEPIQVLRSATSVNAEVFKIGDQAGYLKPGFLADIIAVEGNPLKQISDIRNVRLVMKDGIVYKWDGR
jgi:imidazolonepropionase-like amidohydrolase